MLIERRASYFVLVESNDTNQTRYDEPQPKSQFGLYPGGSSPLLFNVQYPQPQPQFEEAQFPPACTGTGTCISTTNFPRKKKTKTHHHSFSDNNYSYLVHIVWYTKENSRGPPERYLDPSPLHRSNHDFSTVNQP
ncbi:hypothetical protein ACMFMG_007995 [Clarireedia jacksonii]